MKQIKYKEARDLMQPGDLLAFGGSGIISETIKFATFSNVSHVGVVLQTHVPMMDGFINQVIEAVGKHGDRSGVIINRISDHIEEYNGDIWWLALTDRCKS